MEQDKRLFLRLCEAINQFEMKNVNKYPDLFFVVKMSEYSRSYCNVFLYENYEDEDDAIDEWYFRSVREFKVWAKSAYKEYGCA